jgi:hypothetical protein
MQQRATVSGIDTGVPGERARLIAGRQAELQDHRVMPGRGLLEPAGHHDLSVRAPRRLIGLRDARYSDSHSETRC